MGTRAIHELSSPEGGEDPAATGFFAVGRQSPHAPKTYFDVTTTQETSSSASCLGSGGGDGAELSCTGALKVLPLLREAAVNTFWVPGTRKDVASYGG
jgi:hypothetical protein